MIHANSFLSSIDKFNYLKSYLEGETLRSIEVPPLSEANYQAALDILKRRYACTAFFPKGNIIFLGKKERKLENKISLYYYG